METALAYSGPIIPKFDAVCNHPSQTHRARQVYLLGMVGTAKRFSFVAIYTTCLKRLGDTPI